MQKSEIRKLPNGNFIRKNKKFSGIEELSHQLDQDKRDIKQYFYKLKN